MSDDDIRAFIDERTMKVPQEILQGIKEQAEGFEREAISGLLLDSQSHQVLARGRLILRVSPNQFLTLWLHPQHVPDPLPSGSCILRTEGPSGPLDSEIEEVLTGGVGPAAPHLYLRPKNP